MAPYMENNANETENGGNSTTSESPSCASEKVRDELIRDQVRAGCR